MSKKVINQNTNYDFELINSIESKFTFNERPINRLEKIITISKEKNGNKEKGTSSIKS